VFDSCSTACDEITQPVSAPVKCRSGSHDPCWAGREMSTPAFVDFHHTNNIPNRLHQFRHQQSSAPNTYIMVHQAQVSAGRTRKTAGVAAGGRAHDRLGKCYFGYANRTNWSVRSLMTLTSAYRSILITRPITRAEIRGSDMLANR